MRKFEIPYNFDKQIVDKILELNAINDCYLYIPTWIEDGKDTRYIARNKDLYPKSRIEYEHILTEIHNKGINISILMQDFIVEEKIVQYYIDLGIKRFIVRFDETAEIIRKLFPEATIVASITQRLNFAEICNLKEGLYDEIVLFFPFNRNYPILKKLPEKYKYIMLVNTQCSTDCPAIHHWYMEEGKKTESICYAHNINFINIPAEHLSLFDEYIDCYKIQGREWSTMEILEAIEYYINAPKYDFSKINDKKVFFDKYKDYKFLYLPEEYTGKNYKSHIINNFDYYLEKEENILVHYSTTSSPASSGSFPKSQQ